MEGTRKGRKERWSERKGDSVDRWINRKEGRKEEESTRISRTSKNILTNVC